MGKINKFQYGYKVPTRTWGDIGNLLNRGAEFALKVFEPVGKAVSSVASNLPAGGASAVLPQQSPKNFQQSKQRQKIFEEKVGPALSPTNHAIAWTQGSLNPKVGQQKLAEWGPLAQLGSFVTDAAAFKYVPKVPRAISRTKAGKSYLISKEIDKGVKQNTKNGRVEVTSSYFNAPDKWYRITERPEKMGIEEQGKNITTADDPEIFGTINGWRTSVLDNPIETGKGVNEGYFVKKPKKIDISIRRTHGRAHGNTSQAAKGQLWQANTAGSNIFPGGIIEGQAPLNIPYGLSRTHFVNTPWEEVPKGGRVGFHTGEMPMSNLGWFQKTKNGNYTYEPIIPEKRIQISPTPQKETHPWELSNSEYSRFQQPNGKIRLQLNSHTEAKPRQFVLDPQGDNKYYVHMRVWDDADKKVPATMSSADKNTLYEALYNELPEGGEILFPKSGPGNYGTRGTVAGLQHLSRNTGFTPGTPGTLQYLDKDGKTVRTYNGTSFIKNKVSREIQFMDPLPDLPPKTMPYVEAARKFKENNIKFRAQEARNYATSQRRKALDRLLNWEAHNMGFLNEGENLQFVMPHNKLPKVKIYDEQIPGEDFGVNGSYDDRFNTVNLTGVSSQGLTPYHEYLHYYGIGASPVIYQTKLGRAYYNIQPNGQIGKSLGPTSEQVIGTQGVLKRSDAYRTYKLGNILDPDEWNLLSDKEKAYIGSEELPVHALTTGKDLGIKTFQKYPGDLEMINIANKARTKNPWLRVVKYKTSKDLKNFWKLLTGSYLAVQPFMLNEKE